VSWNGASPLAFFDVARDEICLVMIIRVPG